MEKTEIVSILRTFGLNEYESRAYSTLVFIGPSRVGEISKKADVPQPKMYGILDRLCERNLVEIVGGRPKEYKAIEPETGLKGLIDMRQNEVAELKSRADVLKNFLHPLGLHKEVVDGVWTAKGRGQQDFINRLSQMYDKSEGYAMLITRDFTQSSRIAESVRRGVKRGVKFKTISMKGIDESNFYRAKWYHTNGVEIRVFRTKIHPRIFVVDGKEVLIRLDKNPAKSNKFEFTSIWSSDPSLAKVFDVYMKNLWNMAEPVNLKKIEKSLKLDKERTGDAVA